MGLPPQHVIDAISRTQEQRGWIISSFAQIEYLLGDLVFRSFEMPEYEHLGNEQPTKMYSILQRVKAILEVEDGYFSEYEERLIGVIEQIEDHLDQRHVLAHGHMTTFHDPNNNIQYRFRKWHRVQGNVLELVHDCFPVHIDYQATQLRQFATEISEVVRDVHDDLGLIPE